MRCLSCQSTIAESKATYTKPCRHVFCMDCSSKRFKEELVCPLCDTVLPKDGVVEIDLRPDKSAIQRASEPGFGMQPKYLCQILQNGLEFWAQQQQNEHSIHLQIQKSIKEDLEAEKASNRKLTLAVENERRRMTALQKETEELQHRLQDLQQRYTEKSRSLRKLNDMYNDLRQLHKRLESDLRRTKIDDHVHVAESNRQHIAGERDDQDAISRRRNKYGTSRSDTRDTSRHNFKERPRSSSISRSLHLSIPGSARGSTSIPSQGRFDFKLDSRPESRAESRPSLNMRNQRDRGSAHPGGNSSRYE